MSYEATQSFAYFIAKAEEMQNVVFQTMTIEVRALLFTDHKSNHFSR